MQLAGSWWNEIAALHSQRRRQTIILAGTFPSPGQYYLLMNTAVSAIWKPLRSKILAPVLFF